MANPQHADEVPRARRLACLQTADVLVVLADHYGVALDNFAQLDSSRKSPAVAACLARRLTPASLREPAPHFGLNHPDSVSNLSNLTRRADRQLRD